MGKTHRYAIDLVCTGNLGTGTSGYRDFSRDHEVGAPGKSTILGSSDPHFRGDGSRWNPEETLVVSLSQCHQLWYLHLCADAGVIVTAYEDHAVGEMAENPDGSGQFVTVTLHPKVTISAESDADKAMRLHHKAHDMCFIARSVNFPVECEPTVEQPAA